MKRDLMDQMLGDRGPARPDLDASGLVQRSPKPDDRRSFRIAPTDKGRELVVRAIEPRLEMVESLVADLGDEEREQAADLLRRILMGGGGPRD